ncbi:MAG TPA: ABC transporter substrate-binding protein [Burkholderiales bacterium]|nr:ABC transporter substrate-binding protein [Burkholderiales bacterium]HTT37606.1 ABC transporter substrate-binding protein [Burkholderiales bacterium]
MLTRYVWLAAGLALAATLGPARAEKRYDPGASDTEIRIGQTKPYSGPASAYGAGGRVQIGYFEKLNAEGGINGRKIKLISLDDGFSPPRTVEQTRKLVEQDEVLVVFNSNGTAANSAVQKYLNAKKVPQLFVSTGASKFADPKSFPWTIGWLPTYYKEARAYAQYVVRTRPNAKIAVLYQNDDFGKDYLNGLHDELGDKAKRMIVAESSFELSDPTVDSQVVSLRASGADVFFNIGTPKFSALAIRKAYDIGWKPLQFLAMPGSSVGQVMIPAGTEKGVGAITVGFVKDPTDPQWDNDPAMKEWRAFMRKYYPDGDLNDWYNVYAYAAAQTLVQVLKQCGDELTRENVMAQATNLKNLELPLLLPGIRINTTPTDYHVIRQVQLQRFDGRQWVRFGEVIGN